jgi:DNA-binding MarR family transcriptional regulator
MNDHNAHRRPDVLRSTAMSQRLGALLESFVNAVSHPRGRALAFLAKSSVTVDQAVLLNHALSEPGSTPTSLAAKMNLSLPSVSQMLERLVKIGLVKRAEDPLDRRRKTIEPTPKARRFLRDFQAIRSSEYAAGTAPLSRATKQQLVAALGKALEELKREHTVSEGDDR